MFLNVKLSKISKFKSGLFVMNFMEFNLKWAYTYVYFCLTMPIYSPLTCFPCT